MHWTRLNNRPPNTVGDLEEETPRPHALLPRCQHLVTLAQGGQDECRLFSGTTFGVCANAPAHRDLKSKYPKRDDGWQTAQMPSLGQFDILGKVKRPGVFVLHPATSSRQTNLQDHNVSSSRQQARGLSRQNGDSITDSLGGHYRFITEV